MCNILVYLVFILILTIPVESNFSLESINENGLFDWFCTFGSSRISLILHFSVYHITVKEPTHSEIKQSDSIIYEIPGNGSLETLKLSKLDPNLPFIFFTNGYNSYGAFNKTWMYKVADVLAEHEKVISNNKLAKANYVFLFWYMKSSSINLDFIPEPLNYLTTVAHYEHVVRNIALTLDGIVDLVEDEHKVWPSTKFRFQFYSQFKFYGHSLGAHAIAQAIILVHKKRPSIKFGKIIGLDPAKQCFLSDAYGFSRFALDESIHQVQVIHTNSAILSHSSPRGQIEIILNGGTFQPNCSWYDVSCSHSRCADILTYFDSNCQMVAYRCNSLKHFKLGACETCDYNERSSDCILVNLEGQYFSEDVESLVSNYNHQLKLHLDSKTNNTLTDNQYYYVNTNPNFNSGMMTHCLQHYQMRLIIINDDLLKSKKCKLNLFTKLSPHQIQVKLFHTQNRITREMTLTNIIDDNILVFSGLSNFEGKPERYESANIVGIDLDLLAKCSNTNRLETEHRLVFDLAFMSNMDKDIRHTFSSVLCGQWSPNDTRNKELTLNLCEQSEFENISKEIINHLARVEFNYQFDSWHEMLLNRLFSLFLGWKPLR